jgi:hypothetical protein
VLCESTENAKARLSKRTSRHCQTFASGLKIFLLNFGKMGQEGSCLGRIMKTNKTLLRLTSSTYLSGLMMATEFSAQTTSPLYELLNQINEAAKAGLHLVAIGMAVSLPSICASLSREDGRSGGREFKRWCSNNLPKDQFSFVTPDDLYSMRCGVLHQGRYGDLEHNVSRVIFVPPGSSTFINCKFNDAYVYDVIGFCRSMCNAAFAWYENNRTNPTIRKNIAKMMQYYPNGLPPYIVGYPVIA